jgi:hypothetical protein
MAKPRFGLPSLSQLCPPNRASTTPPTCLYSYPLFEGSGDFGIGGPADPGLKLSARFLAAVIVEEEYEEEEEEDVLAVG